MENLSTEDFEDMKNREDFVLIDVLSREQFEDGHIPGAINIPYDQVGDIVEKLLTHDQNIVVYCASEGCGASETAAEKLEDLGFSNVMDYEAGKQGWQEAGHELEA
ncbi:MAG: rhodanese-like domain-containing protein [Candidatus Nanohaloarchaea archaeon]